MHTSGNIIATELDLIVPHNLSATQITEPNEESICLFIAGIMLSSQDYDSEKVRMSASVLIDRRLPLPVSHLFIEALAGKMVTPPLPPGGESEELFLRALSGRERATLAIKFLGTRLAEERHVCPGVRKQVVDKFLRSRTRAQAFTLNSKLYEYVAAMNREFSKNRFICGCKECVVSRRPKSKDPQVQLYISAFLELSPYCFRTVSKFEIARAVDLTRSFMTSKRSHHCSMQTAGRGKIDNYLKSCNDVGSLASEAALLHYAGNFSAQAAVEKRLDPLLDKVYDFREEEERLYHHLRRALYRIYVETPTTRLNLLPGYAVCFAQWFQPPVR